MSDSKKTINHWFTTNKYFEKDNGEIKEEIQKYLEFGKIVDNEHDFKSKNDAFNNIYRTLTKQTGCKEIINKIFGDNITVKDIQRYGQTTGE